MLNFILYMLPVVLFTWLFTLSFEITGMFFTALYLIFGVIRAFVQAK